MRTKGSREYGFRQSHGGRAKFPGGEWGENSDFGHTSEYRESDSYERSPQLPRGHEKEWDRSAPTRDERSEDERLGKEFNRSRLAGPYTGGQFFQSQYGLGGRYDRDWKDHTTRDYGLWDMNFAGRGPKGYKRSDERIREDVCEALYLDPLVDASDIEVKVAEGHVTLLGTVDNRAAKREAERAIEQISGIVDIYNELRLEDNSERRSEH